MEHTYRIVVGVDGSDGGQAALRWALHEAAQRGGTVQAVTAWHWDGPTIAPRVDASPQVVRERAMDTLARQVGVATRATQGPPPLAVEAVAGDAATVLTRTAADADVLVLGSHGHSRLRHAVLGSVSEACIRRATCPVVVIPVPVPATAPAGTLVEPVTA